MLNDIAQIPLDFLDWLYENPFIGAYFDMWEDLGDAISSYSGTLTNLLEGVYFFFTKDLVVFTFNFWLVICLAAFIFALINLIGQFIP